MRIAMLVISCALVAGSPVAFSAEGTDQVSSTPTPATVLRTGQSATPTTETPASAEHRNRVELGTSTPAEPLSQPQFQPVQQPGAKHDDNDDDPQKQGVASSQIAVVRAVAPLALRPPFWDVPLGSLFSEEVGWARRAGITTGWPDGSFKPQKQVERQAAAAFFYRLAGNPNATTQPRFGDVSSSHPFYREISWLAQNGITTGWSDGTFKPRQALTREAMAAMIHRFCARYANQCSSALQRPAATLQHWDDVDSSNPFADDIAWLSDTGITQGMTPTTFAPKEPLSRVAMIAFAYRLKHNYLPGNEPLPQDPADVETPLGKPLYTRNTPSGTLLVYADHAQIGNIWLDGELFNRWRDSGAESGPYGYPTSHPFFYYNFKARAFSKGKYMFEGGPTRSLNVPWFGQPNNYYCGPTSGTMLLASRGLWQSADGRDRLSPHALATHKYMNTNYYGFTSFYDFGFVNGVNRWIGLNVYTRHHAPSPGFVRDQILRSFTHRWPVILETQERRGGPHFNGHNNSTYAHIMVADGYNMETDALYVADPGGEGHVWSHAARKFWYPSLEQFVNTWMSHDAPHTFAVGTFAPTGAN